jgi:hypothetical protein
MFQDELREDVYDIDRGLEDMIWRIVTRYADLSGGRPLVDSRAAYSMFDGVFETALRDHLAHRAGAVEWLRTQVATLMPGLCARPA